MHKYSLNSQNIKQFKVYVNLHYMYCTVQWGTYSVSVVCCGIYVYSSTLSLFDESSHRTKVNNYPVIFTTSTYGTIFYIYFISQWKNYMQDNDVPERVSCFPSLHSRWIGQQHHSFKGTVVKFMSKFSRFVYYIFFKLKF